MKKTTFEVEFVSQTEAKATCNVCKSICGPQLAESIFIWIKSHSKGHEKLPKLNPLKSQQKIKKIAINNLKKARKDKELIKAINEIGR